MRIDIKSMIKKYYIWLDREMVVYAERGVWFQFVLIWVLLLEMYLYLYVIYQFSLLV